MAEFILLDAELAMTGIVSGRATPLLDMDVTKLLQSRRCKSEWRR